MHSYGILCVFVLCLSLSLSEDQYPMRIRINSSRERAEMFVLLTGSCTVKHDGEQEHTTYGPGDVFGSLEGFEHPKAKIETDPKKQKKPIDSTLMLEKGCMLRLSFNDYYTQIVNPVKKTKEEVKKKTSAYEDTKQNINGMMDKALTKDVKKFLGETGLLGDMLEEPPPPAPVVAKSKKNNKSADKEVRSRSAAEEGAEGRSPGVPSRRRGNRRLRAVARVTVVSKTKSRFSSPGNSRPSTSGEGVGSVEGVGSGSGEVMYGDEALSQTLSIDGSIGSNVNISQVPVIPAPKQLFSPVGSRVPLKGTPSGRGSPTQGSVKGSPTHTHRKLFGQGEKEVEQPRSPGPGSPKQQLSRSASRQFSRQGSNASLASEGMGSFASGGGPLVKQPSASLLKQPSFSHLMRQNTGKSLTQAQMASNLLMGFDANAEEYSDYSGSDYSGSSYSSSGFDEGSADGSDSDSGASFDSDDDGVGGAGGAMESDENAGEVTQSRANPTQANAMRYIMQGSANRSLIVHRGDTRMVYIILDGSVRLSMQKHGGAPGAITCTRSRAGGVDRQAHSVKSSNIPLVCLENGAIISLADECFAVADHYNPLTGEIEEPVDSKDKPNGKPNKKQSSSIVSQKLHTDIENANPPKLINPPDDTSVTASTLTTEDEDVEKPPERQQYDILLTFQKPTTYIAVPYNIFRAAMRERSGHVTMSISRLIMQIGATVQTRIEPLLPWLYGNLVVEFVEERKSTKPKYTKLPGGFTRGPPPVVAIVPDLPDVDESSLCGATQFNFSLREKQVKQITRHTHNNNDDNNNKNNTDSNKNMLPETTATGEGGGGVVGGNMSDGISVGLA